MRVLPLPPFNVTHPPDPASLEYRDGFREVPSLGETVYLLARYPQHVRYLGSPREVHMGYVMRQKRPEGTVG